MPNTQVYESEFTISDKVYGKVHFNVEILGCDYQEQFYDTNCYFTVSVQSNTDPSIYFTLTASEFDRILPSGTYKIKAIRTRQHIATNPLEIIQDFTVFITWREEENIDYWLVGGQRIKEIRYIDESKNTTLIKKYFYKNENNDMTSGIIKSMPLNKNILNADFIFIACDGCQGGSTPIPFTTKIIDISSNSLAPMGSYNGSVVLYDNVIEKYENNGNDLGYAQYKFHDVYAYGNHLKYPYSPIICKDSKIGKMYNTKWFKRNSNNEYSLIKEKQIEYDYIPSKSSIGISMSYVPGLAMSDWDLQLVPIYPHFRVLQFNSYGIINSKFRYVHEIEKNYYLDGEIITENFVDYTNNKINLISSQTTTSSTGETLETKYYYPQDVEMSAEPNVADLIAKNMIGQPLKTVTNRVKADGTVEKLSEQLTKYGSFATGTAGQTMLLPEFIYTKKGEVSGQALEKKVTYLYDTHGNITQYTPENGMPVSIIWGYNHTLPVAKIEGLAYSAIPSANITAIQTATDATTGYSEANVLTALGNLRTVLSSTPAMITTYTHKPLVGVTTITDPKGDRLTYEYDNFNRLKWVLDKNGNKLSENEYHYKP